MKKITALAVALVMSISLAGCSKQAKESGDSGESNPSVISVTDHAGNTVEVPSNIKKRQIFFQIQLKMQKKKFKDVKFVIVLLIKVFVTFVLIN